MNYIYKPAPVLGKCVLGAQAGPQTIVVRQLVGEGETQRSLDICLRVPRNKPAIEQVVDVFVKRLRITEVRLIPNKVIVCGHFEIKALYVACLPDQPVHAVEMRRVRFTADVPIWGARWGMDADASVAVEFVDYDCPHHRGKHYHDPDECDDPPWKKHGHHGHHGHDGPSCDDDCHDHGHHGPSCDDDCHDHGHHGPPCDDDCHDHGHHGPSCDDDCHDHGHHWCPPACSPCKPFDHGFREINVSVVLCVVAKVLADREVVIYPGQYPGLPAKPKG